jgi:two-component system, chemotaxis family, CheB/CheR fusion protein
MDLHNAALFRLIFENAPNGILLVDEKLVCLDANPAFCSMFGYSRSSILGASCRTFVSPIDNRSLDAAARQLWKNRSWQGELRMPAADDSERTVEWRISTQENDSSAIAILTDVTARRKYEDALAEAKDKAARGQSKAEDASRSKDFFLARISHEMRNPLAAVFGACRVLQQKFSNDREAMKLLEMIERQANVQLHTIEDLHDVTRISAGILKLYTRPIDLSAVVRTAVETIAPAAESKDVALEWKDPSTPIVARADSARFRQVVMNILVNAVKFTPPKGSVEVALGAIGRRAQMIIRDTGIGIESNLIADIFTRYMQGDRDQRKQGLGLGLPIVKHLVELHDGRIEIRSAGKDKGTTVVVEIPLGESSEFERRQCA